MRRRPARTDSWPEAAGAAAAALTLWRGDPLADAGSELLITREAPRLAELRLQALEARIDADLHLGLHKQVISELRQLAGAHPLRENLHGLLMLALYHDDRQGEALAVYAAARRTLVEELGAEPGSGLRQLHQQILGADSSLTLRPPGAAADGGGMAPVPRELPAGIGQFTGRAAELAALTQLLGQPRPTVVISAIGGTAGVGKTALAVHWAQQVASHFDGQLYVNLRGYDPGQPMPATDALAGFLRALGVPGAPSQPKKPSGPPVIAACWRGGECSSSWTTPGRPTRSGRYCPARQAARCSSPAATRWPGLSPAKARPG